MFVIEFTGLLLQAEEERQSRIFRRVDLVQPRYKEEYTEYDEGYNGKPGRLTMSPDYLGELVSPRPD